MVYVTSMPIAGGIVEYYLALLPGVIPSHARARLHLVSVGDGSAAAAEREAARAAAAAAPGSRRWSPTPTHAHLVPYNTTELERDVALSLGIPMYGADPRFEPLGTRPAAAGCSPRSACPTRWAPRTCTPSTDLVRGAA